MRGFLRWSRLPVLLRALLHPTLVVLGGVAVGLAMELVIQLFGAAVVPDALAGLPPWYQVGKAVLFQCAQILPAVFAGWFASRHAGVIGAATAITCALAADLAFHGAMPAAVSELASPLSLAAASGLLGAVGGFAGAHLAQRWRARRAAPSP